MDKMWRKQTKPMALGVLAGMAVFLFALVASQCSCGLVDPVYPRSTAAQYNTSIAIMAICVSSDGDISGWYGSGVVVRAHTILTAAHVAHTPVGKTCMWEGKTRSGGLMMLTPNVVDEKDDLASMLSDQDLPLIAVTYGPKPEIGDTLYDATAQPHRWHRSGELEGWDENTMQTSMLVEPGNSGSGVYDSSGRLVGIVVTMGFCSNGQICGAGIASLDGHVDQLLDLTGGRKP